MFNLYGGQINHCEPKQGEKMPQSISPSKPDKIHAKDKVRLRLSPLSINLVQ